MCPVNQINLSDEAATLEFGAELAAATFQESRAGDAVLEGI